MRESRSNDKLRVQELGVIEETIGTLHHLSLAIRKASNRDTLTRIPRLFDRDSDYTVIREYRKDVSDLGIIVKAVQFEISSTFEEFVRKVLVSRWLRPNHEAELDSEQKRYREALLDRCVEAVSVRRRQLAYFHSHQLKLAGGSSTKFVSSTQQHTDQELGRNSYMQLQSKLLKALNLSQPILLETSDAAPSETVATEFQSTTIRLAPPSSAPSSTTSSNADGGFRSGGPFEAPPPPKLNAGDKENACPYCCLVLPAKIFSTQKRAKRWERHLLEDLQPYICLFENCTQRGKSYSSFKDWQAHLNQPHYHSWLCPLHPEDADDADEGPFLFANLARFRAHLDIYHTDLDLSTTEDLIHRASQLAALPQWCFICFEELPTLPVLQKHMADHLKSMSLLALPWRDDIGDEEGCSSDQLKSMVEPSHASPLSETYLASISLFEDADADETLPELTLEPKEFASLLSIVNANAVTVQDRANDLELWAEGKTLKHVSVGILIVTDHNEKKSLHDAPMNEHVEVVKLLLETGEANVESNSRFVEENTDTILEDPRISLAYNKCLLDVYADFMNYCVEKSQSLDILCRYWAPLPKPPSLEANLDASPQKGLKQRNPRNTSEEMPTWISFIEKSTFNEPHSVLGTRINSDSLVGGPGRPQVYNASNGLRAWAIFGTYNPEPDQGVNRSLIFPTNSARRSSLPSDKELGFAKTIQELKRSQLDGTPESLSHGMKKQPLVSPQKYDGTLSVRGFYLDVVQKISPRAIGKSIIPFEALYMGGWKRSDQDVPDQLWRTLVADRGPNGTSAPGWYRRACLECLQHMNRVGDLDIEDLKKKVQTPSTMVTFLERVQQVVWGQRFFMTRGNVAKNKESLFCLGSPSVREGDMVCIIFGCSVPVVLRKVSTGGGNSHFEFISECYVHGMMDGEALEGRMPVYPYGGKKTLVTTFKLK